MLPATEPHPAWLTPATISGVAAYLAYQVHTLLAAMPGRAIFCEHSGGLVLNLPSVAGCDYASLLIEQRPTWLALALGSSRPSCFSREKAAATFCCASPAHIS